MLQKASKHTNDDCCPCHCRGINLNVVMQESEYDDSFPTCVETNSTLRIYSNDITPDEITKVLQIEPTKTFRKDESHALGKLQRKTNGWFYSTNKLSRSKDTRRHLDIILRVLEGKSDLVGALRARGCKIDIMSYWVSIGQGGPWLMAEQMLKLGTLGISVWWDIYFREEDRWTEDTELPDPGIPSS